MSTAPSPQPPQPKRLELRFHGRVIDHLGIQMYQSPVAAVAELVANAWDADADNVRISLPQTIQLDAEFAIADDGVGMSFAQCQDRFLVVGYNRRGDDPAAHTDRGRPVLGRKGIGKFAGFGIASRLDITTVSAENGEMTRFHLDLEAVRSGKEYADPEPIDIDVLEYLPPDDARRAQHGTTVRLSGLTIKRRSSPEAFARSMARRFLMHEQVEDFKVFVDDLDISAVGDEIGSVEFEYPRDLPPEYRDDVATRDGWGDETLPDGNGISWRIVFYGKPINEEELTGVAVFAHGKLVQRPFFFNLTGGLGGQHGQAYLSGRVEASFLDEQTEDLVSTERQRVSWEHETATPLLEWGQRRVQQLLRLWQQSRAEKKVAALTERLRPLGERLGRLPTEERRVIERALQNIARVSALDDDSFERIARSVLTVWEGGRLQGLIRELAASESFDDTKFIRLLTEVDVLTALHTAEAIRTRLEAIHALKAKIAGKELEKTLRDHVAQHPWLIAPEWDTFRIEKRVDHVLTDAARTSGIDKDPEWEGRIDLVLSAGRDLLVLEFMRPGATLDWNHVERFERYVRLVRAHLEGLTGSPFYQGRATGYVIADNVSRDGALVDKLNNLAQDGMLAMDWALLFSRAEASWREFLDILVERTPEDPRLRGVASGAVLPEEASDDQGAEGHPPPGAGREAGQPR